VAECHSTSSIFRGYSIFMKGKDPRDAHFITSRICGICGDNHATCATYAQNMAFGVKPPALAEWIVNLGEAAEYMFDHNIFQDNLVGVDFCEQMVKETNPGVSGQGQRPRRRTPNLHGYRTIADIMRALNPFTGVFLSRSAADEPHDARDVLPDGRPPRASVHALSRRRRHGADRAAVHRLLVRLMKYVEFMKKVVPLHDDLFDFFYEALPGYEEVGRAAFCWDAGDRSTIPSLRLHLQEHDRLGPEDVRHARRRRRRQAGHNDLVDINLNIRILLGSSYYDDWQNAETFVKTDPLGNPVDKRHPWNQTTTPRPQKRDFNGKYTWVMSPRWFDKRTGDHLALDTGGGPIARLWATALAGWSISATSRPPAQREDLPAQDGVQARSGVRVEDSEVEQRHRARPRAHLLPGLCAAAARCYFCEKALAELHAGRTKTWSDFKVPEEAIGCGFHEAVRGVLSHTW
jgi:hydrogenase large subunit